MAINIFSGSSGKAKVNSASQSSRAQAARSALTGPAETSSSGSTAVKSAGTLSKVGNLVGKVAGVASKFLPGIGGSIASGLANLLNDPEWWQSTPGDAITLNTPLRMVEVGDGPTPGSKTYLTRAAIGDFTTADGSATDNLFVVNPSEQAVTQYLMPQIRKVVNAIPLQTAADYKVVVQVNATIYAMWRQLKKIDYMLKHGQTYLANMNDPMFPLFQVMNAAYLQSTINRLEEYLRANVRLPHTMCEYLAWRFGRVYKSNDSAKAGLITYNVLDLRTAPHVWTNAIGQLMQIIASTPSLQAANTDMYNAYFDHDFMVEIKDETQFTFDCKEFMLRTNCNIAPTDNQAEIPDPVRNAISVDSRLDNPTTFMASSVSTIGIDDSGNVSVLFPIRVLRVYIPGFADLSKQSGDLAITRYRFATSATDQIDAYASIYHPVGSIWVSSRLRPGTTVGVEGIGLSEFVNAMLFTRSLDIYNKGVYLTAIDPNNSDKRNYLDVSSLSIDMGMVDQRVLGIEHVYAFANLVDINRKTSMSYAKAEKLVARDTADFVEKLDVATVAGTTTK